MLDLDAGESPHGYTRVGIVCAPRLARDCVSRRATGAPPFEEGGPPARDRLFLLPTFPGNAVRKSPSAVFCGLNGVGDYGLRRGGARDALRRAVRPVLSRVVWLAVPRSGRPHGNGGHPAGGIPQAGRRVGIANPTGRGSRRVAAACRHEPGVQPGALGQTRTGTTGTRRTSTAHRLGI